MVSVKDEYHCTNKVLPHGEILYFFTKTAEDSKPVHTGSSGDEGVPSLFTELYGNGESEFAQLCETQLKYSVGPYVCAGTYENAINKTFRQETVAIVDLNNRYQPKVSFTSYNDCFRSLSDVKDNKVCALEIDYFPTTNYQVVDLATGLKENPIHFDYDSCLSSR